jgi:hypothetical protein
VQSQPRQQVKHSNIIKVSSIMTTDAGFKVLTLVINKNIIFLDVTLCNLVDIYQHIRGTYCLQGQRIKPSKEQAQQAIQLELPTACSLLVVCSAYSPTLKMVAIYSTEVLINFYQTIQCHIPEDKTLQLLQVFPSISRSLKLPVSLRFSHNNFGYASILPMHATHPTQLSLFTS